MTENRALKQAIRRRMEVTGEKYTEARRAVLDWNSGATKPRHIQEAERLGHDYIGCEHLLLGILADEGDVAARTLTAHGVTLARVKRRTAEIVGDGGRGSVRWSYSPRAVVVRKLAEVEAERLGAALPSPTHTLLAILTEGEGVPNALFGEFEVDLSKLRADLLQQLDIPAGMREMYLRQRNASDRAREQERPPEG